MPPAPGDDPLYDYNALAASLAVAAAKDLGRFVQLIFTGGKDS